jgi:hypothetical protein
MWAGASAAKARSIAGIYNYSDFVAIGASSSPGHMGLLLLWTFRTHDNSEFVWCILLKSAAHLYSTVFTVLSSTGRKFDPLRRSLALFGSAFIPWLVMLFCLVCCGESRQLQSLQVDQSAFQNAVIIMISVFLTSPLIAGFLSLHWWYSERPNGKPNAQKHS